MFTGKQIGIVITIIAITILIIYSRVNGTINYDAEYYKCYTSMMKQNNLSVNKPSGIYTKISSACWEEEAKYLEGLQSEKPFYDCIEEIKNGIDFTFYNCIQKVNNTGHY